MRNTWLILHLFGMAAALGGALVTLAIARTMRDPGLHPFLTGLRSVQLALVRRFTLGGALTAILGGVLLVVDNPDFMKRGWVHAKITLALLALGAIHVEMFALRSLLRVQTSEDTGVSLEAYRKYERRAALGRGATIACLLGILWLAVAKPF